MTALVLSDEEHLRDDDLPEAKRETPLTPTDGDAAQAAMFYSDDLVMFGVTPTNSDSEVSDVVLPPSRSQRNGRRNGFIWKKHNDTVFSGYSTLALATMKERHEHPSHHHHHHQHQHDHHHHSIMEEDRCETKSDDPTLLMDGQRRADGSDALLEAGLELNEPTPPPPNDEDHNDNHDDDRDSDVRDGGIIHDDIVVHHHRHPPAIPMAKLEKPVSKSADSGETKIMMMMDDHSLMECDEEKVCSSSSAASNPSDTLSRHVSSGVVAGSSPSLSPSSLSSSAKGPVAVATAAASLSAAAVTGLTAVSAATAAVSTVAGATVQPCSSSSTTTTTLLSSAATANAGAPTTEVKTARSSSSSSSSSTVHRVTSLSSVTTEYTREDGVRVSTRTTTTTRVDSAGSTAGPAGASASSTAATSGIGSSSSSSSSSASSGSTPALVAGAVVIGSEIVCVGRGDGSPSTAENTATITAEAGGIESLATPSGAHKAAVSATTAASTQRSRPAGRRVRPSSPRPVRGAHFRTNAVVGFDDSTTPWMTATNPNRSGLSVARLDSLAAESDQTAPSVTSGTRARRLQWDRSMSTTMRSASNPSDEKISLLTEASLMRWNQLTEQGPHSSSAALTSANKFGYRISKRRRRRNSKNNSNHAMMYSMHLNGGCSASSKQAASAMMATSVGLTGESSSPIIAGSKSIGISGVSRKKAGSQSSTMLRSAMSVVGCQDSSTTSSSRKPRRRRRGRRRLGQRSPLSSRSGSLGSLPESSDSDSVFASAAEAVRAADRIMIATQHGNDGDRRGNGGDSSTAAQSGSVGRVLQELKESDAPSRSSEGSTDPSSGENFFLSYVSPTDIEFFLDDPDRPPGLGSRSRDALNGLRYRYKPTVMSAEASLMRADQPVLMSAAQLNRDNTEEEKASMLDVSPVMLAADLDGDDDDDSDAVVIRDPCADRSGNASNLSVSPRSTDAVADHIPNPPAIPLVGRNISLIDSYASATDSENEDDSDDSSSMSDAAFAAAAARFSRQWSNSRREVVITAVPRGSAISRSSRMPPSSSSMAGRKRTVFVPRHGNGRTVTINGSSSARPRLSDHNYSAHLETRPYSGQPVRHPNLSCMRSSGNRRRFGFSVRGTSSTSASSSSKMMIMGHPRRNSGNRQSRFSRPIPSSYDDTMTAPLTTTNDDSNNNNVVPDWHSLTVEIPELEDADLNDENHDHNGMDNDHENDEEEESKHSCSEIPISPLPRLSQPRDSSDDSNEMSSFTEIYDAGERKSPDSSGSSISSQSSQSTVDSLRLYRRRFGPTAFSRDQRGLIADAMAPRLPPPPPPPPPPFAGSGNVHRISLPMHRGMRDQRSSSVTAAAVAAAATAATAAAAATVQGFGRQALDASPLARRYPHWDRHSYRHHHSHHRSGAGSGRSQLNRPASISVSSGAAGSSSSYSARSGARYSGNPAHHHHHPGHSHLQRRHPRRHSALGLAGGAESNYHRPPSPLLMVPSPVAGATAGFTSPPPLLRRRGSLPRLSLHPRSSSSMMTTSPIRGGDSDEDLPQLPTPPLMPHTPNEHYNHYIDSLGGLTVHAARRRLSHASRNLLEDQSAGMMPPSTLSTAATTSHGGGRSSSSSSSRVVIPTQPLLHPALAADSSAVSLSGVAAPPPPTSTASSTPEVADPNEMSQRPGESERSYLERLARASWSGRVSDLPTRVLSEEDSRRMAAAGESCTICLSEFSAGDSCRRLLCGHEFCRDCIDSWFQTPRGGRTCPLCKFNHDVSGSRPGSTRMQRIRLRTSEVMSNSWNDYWM